MPKIEQKKMGGRVVTISKKEKKDKVRPAEEYAEDQRQGLVPASELVSWFKKTYPGTEPVHRGNGVSYHLQGKKVIKEPEFENKEGVFFGRVMNKIFIGAGMEEMPDLQWHHKSEVFKIPPKVDVNTLRAIKAKIKQKFPKEA